MKVQGFVGPSYNESSVTIDCQRCVNLYPEIIESGSGKDSAQAYLVGTPGLEKILNIGTGPIRLIHVDDPTFDPLNPTNRVFIVSGSELFLLTYNSTTQTWSSSKLGNLNTTTGPVRAASQQISLGVTIFVDGSTNYVYSKTPSGSSFTQSFGSFGGAGYVGVPNATSIVWLDSFLIFNSANTNQFYVTDWNSITVNPLSFASNEGDPDSIVGMITKNRDLFLFNERSIEIYTNTGNADFPFERVQGGFIEKGCLASGSIAKIDGLIMWLGRDASGQGQIYAIDGLVPKRISTHPIEQAISTYANPSAATAFTYSKNGHSFYVISFAEATWCYDISTGLWHERAYNNQGVLERHRLNGLVFFPFAGFHMGGDYQNNKVYKLNEDVMSDDGAEIISLRAFPHLSAEGARLFHKYLQIDMETGIGIDGSNQGSDPVMTLDYSDDGGHSWSSEQYAKIGKLGNYKARVIFRRLGSSRDRVYRIKVSDPIKRKFINAFIDVEGGNS